MIRKTKKEERRKKEEERRRKKKKKKKKEKEERRKKTENRIEGGIMVQERQDADKSFGLPSSWDE